MTAAGYLRGGIGAARWGPKASHLGPALSLPFEALFETLLREERGQETATGWICRDSKGRVRMEYRISQAGVQGATDVVTITDREARSIIALDTAASLATQFTDFGPPPGQPPPQGWAYEGPWLWEDRAEEKMIEGVPCRKVVRAGWPLGTALKPGEAGEIWICDELKYSIFERVIDPEGEYSWRLYNIQRTEPPQSLFAVPNGYTIVSRSKRDPSRA